MLMHFCTKICAPRVGKAYSVTGDRFVMRRNDSKNVFKTSVETDFIFKSRVGDTGGEFSGQLSAGLEISIIC